MACPIAVTDGVGFEDLISVHELPDLWTPNFELKMLHCNFIGRWHVLWSLLLGSLLLSTSLSAQDGALRFDRLTVEDGLSYSTIWSIHQDSQGFMWFGTGEGLNRYDGYRFKVFKHDPEDPKSLSDVGVTAIAEDNQVRLWLGTVSGGLNRFHRDDESFERFRHDPADERSLADNGIYDLLVDRHGTLWVATPAGLDRFDEPTGSFQHNPQEPTPADPSISRLVIDIFEDKDGVLWLGTEHGLGRFDPRTESFTRFSHDPADPNSLSQGATYSIQQDASGDLWIASEDGLNRFDLLTGKFTRYVHNPDDPASLGHNNIASMAFDASGQLWVGTDNQGLSRLDPLTGRFTHHRQDLSDSRSLLSDLVTELFVDRNGLLWIGSYTGISKYDPRRDDFTVYRQQQWRQPTLSGVSAWAVTQDRSGVLWLGTEKGLDRFDRQRGTIESFQHDPNQPDGLQSGPIATMLEDRSGTLWVGTWGGLSRLDAESQRFVHIPSHDPDDPQTLSSDLIQFLYEDSRDRLWVGTLGGLNQLDRATGRVVRYPAQPGDPEALGEDTIYSILEDHTGTLWIGTRDHGLFRFDEAPSRAFVQYEADPKDPAQLGSNDIACMHEDASGNLWLGTNGAGLHRLDPARQAFVRYRQQDGLNSDSIVGLLEDDDGFLWLSTHSGLSRFDPQTETFRNYDSADGLASNDHALVASHRGLRGEMFFGSVGGLTAFFPNRVRDDDQPPSVVITDFQLFNRSVQPRSIDPDSPLEGSVLDARQLTLSHHDYVFAFEFAALHYVDPRQNRYAYRLEGFDRDWIETDASQRFAQYSNLAAGDYVFRVKASNDDEVWNEDGAAIAVHILPPPWKTWWAYTLYFLALAGALFAYVRWQERKVERERAINHRLREVDRLKDEFLANTSHELRTPLYGIVGIAESLINGAAGEPSEEIKSNLEMVVTSGRRLGGLINDILDFSRLTGKSLELERQPVDLRALVDVVLNLSRPLVGDKELTLDNDIDPSLPSANADEDRLQQIFHNLIGNAVKFTTAGKIEISAVAGEKLLEVRVADTGRGISDGDVERIFESFEQGEGSAIREFGGTGLGLAVTKQLVSLHGGSIWVESKVGVGTTFFFTVPMADRPASDRPASDRPASDRPVSDRPITSGSIAGASVMGETATGGREDTAGAPTLDLDQSSIDSMVEDPIRAAERSFVEPLAHDEQDAAKSKSTLLIVDDEPVIRQVLWNYLAQDYRVVSAASGPEALQILSEQPIDLVLLDVMMPKMSGYEVCRRLRLQHALARLPVLFLTAKSQASDRVVGLSAGANDYLTKPVARGELLARVATHLELRSINRELSELVHERTVQIEERERLLRERERLILQLEARNDELARFNYTVSHDLKNPLTTIRNYIGILSRDAHAGNQERVQQDLRRIDAAACQLTQSLDELYEFSRVGQQQNPHQNIPFVELVEEVRSQLVGAITERGVNLVIVPKLPIVRGDRPRLLEVVRHLLDNAIRYMGDQLEPRIEIGVRTDRSKMGSTTGVFFVRDNGRGINRRYRQKVFELFERLDPEGSEGTGIGLALVKRIVELHAGRIWVESAGDAQGSTFCFTLPVVDE